MDGDLMSLLLLEVPSLSNRTDFSNFARSWARRYQAFFTRINSRRSLVKRLTNSMPKQINWSESIFQVNLTQSIVKWMASSFICQVKSLSKLQFLNLLLIHFSWPFIFLLPELYISFPDEFLPPRLRPKKCLSLSENSRNSWPAWHIQSKAWKRSLMGMKYFCSKQTFFLDI